MSEAPDFGTFGRFEETSVGDMAADMKEAYDFTMKLRGPVPGPHRIWLANPELSKTVVPIGAYYQTRSTLTKPEIEIATNLVNGRWSAAYSNYEHEIMGEKAGGLPPEKVEAMIAGRPTSFDDPRQQVVYELASALEHLTKRLNRLWIHMTARIRFNIPTGTKGPVMNGEALFR
jgi:4-carboxymuconolactone decarboxylase